MSIEVGIVLLIVWDVIRLFAVAVVTRWWFRKKDREHSGA